MLKRIVLLMLTVLLLGFGACGGHNQGQSEANGSSSSIENSSMENTFNVPVGAVEITDTFDSIYETRGVYDATNGWKGNKPEGASTYAFFLVDVSDGDTLYFDFSETTEYMVYLMGDPNAIWTTDESFTINGSGCYMFITKTDVNVKVYVVSSNSEI